MGSFPWGPHGPETSPNQVKPNPTPSDPVGQFGQDDSYAAQPATGYAGGGGGGPFLSIAASLVMAPLVWMFWICLYPMTAVAGVFAGVLSWSLLSRVLTARDVASVAPLGGVIAGYAAVIIVSRIEFKLTQNIALRQARHAVRLVLFGALAIPWFQGVIMNAKVGGSSTRYIFAVLSHPQFLLAQMANRQNLGIVLAVMVGMHFLLWKAERLRAYWHRRLFWLGLK
jgi:hypothetical protein